MIVQAGRRRVRMRWSYGAAVRSRVQELVLDFCRGELRDDLTMLALRVGGPPVP